MIGLLFHDKILISATVAYVFSAALMLFAGAVSTRAASFFFTYLIIMSIRIFDYIKIPDNYKSIFARASIVPLLLFVFCGYQVAGINNEVRENNAKVYKGGEVLTLKTPDYSQLNQVVKKIGLRYNSETDLFCDDLAKYWISGWTEKFYNVSRLTKK